MGGISGELNKFSFVTVFTITNGKYTLIFPFFIDLFIFFMHS